MATVEIAERADLSPKSPIWGEHRSRYHFAANFVSGKTVLDIACGTGFGEKILVDAGAVRIFATDFSLEALNTTKELRTPQTYIFRSDGLKLPFADNTIEVITSFETVEHIADYRGFVEELRRVLRNDGIMIMSTPNAFYTKPVDGKPINPFHVYEFTPVEFKGLLEPHFSNIELLGQRVRSERRLCPFWELPEMLPNDGRSKILIALWKIQARLPFNLKETVSFFFTGEGFYPGEDDFIFSPSELETGYTQVAVCRP